MVSDAVMFGDSDTKDDVVEVVVLLLDRNVNTELLFPEWIRSLYSGEGISPYEEASECDSQPSEAEANVEVDGDVSMTGESIGDCVERGIELFLLNRNIASR
jgi:hypothetical protein